MNDEWLLAVALCGALLLALDITRRAFMEMQQLEQEQRIKKAMRRLRKPLQPWVTVLLYGENEDAFERTMRQIRQNRYDNFDVVRVKKHTAAGHRTAYRKSKRGEIILCVQAGDAIDRQCIKRAVVLRTLQLSQRTRTKQSWSVPIASPTFFESGIRGIVQQLRFVLFAQSASAIPAFTRQGLRVQTQVQTPAKDTRLIFVVAGALFMATVITGALLNTKLFIYGWLLLSAYLLVLIWLSSPARLGYGSRLGRTAAYQKVRLSFAVPSALFLVPVASCIGGIFQLSTRK